MSQQITRLCSVWFSWSPSLLYTADWVGFVESLSNLSITVTAIQTDRLYKSLPLCPDVLTFHALVANSGHLLSYRYCGQAPRFHFQTPPWPLPTFSAHPIRPLILQPAAGHSRTLFPECKGPGALYTVTVHRDVHTALGNTACQLFKFNTHLPYDPAA